MGCVVRFYEWVDINIIIIVVLVLFIVIVIAHKKAKAQQTLKGGDAYHARADIDRHSI